MRVVIGHSRRPLYAGSLGARDARGSGPGTKGGERPPRALNPAAVMFIFSRFHVSICIGVTCHAVGESRIRAYPGGKPWYV